MITSDMEIRLATERDVEGILAIYAPYIEHSWTSFEETVPDHTSMWNRIADILQESPWLVLTSGGVVAGYAYANNHRWRAAYIWAKEVSVYVHPDFRNRGVAHKLYAALFNILKVQGVKHVLAGVALPNEASVNFHLKQGFSIVGTYRGIGYKFGTWHDISWYQMTIAEGNPDKRPVLLSDMTDEQVAAALL